MDDEEDTDEEASTDEEAEDATTPRRSYKKKVVFASARTRLVQAWRSHPTRRSQSPLKFAIRTFSLVFPAL